MDLDTIKSRFQGTIIGGAVGEALGNPVEGWTPKEIADDYGVLNKYVEMYDGPGTCTDDMELETSIAQSLVYSGGFDLNDIARSIARWGADPTSPGMACQSAAVKLSQGISPFESGTDSAGNGAAMRVASLGLLYSLPQDIELLRECVIKSSEITHDNNEAVAGALAIAYGITHNLNSEKYDVNNFLRDVSEFVRGDSKEMSERIRSIHPLLKESEHKAIQELGTGGYVMQSVPLSVYCFAKSPRNYEESIIRAVNAGGDADTNAKMTGNLSGSLNGIEAIPGYLVDGLKPTNWIKKQMINNDDVYSMKDYLLYLSDGLFNLYKFNLPEV